MDKIHKTIMALLIVAILFSAISIIINLNVSNISIPKERTDSNPADVGSVSLYVEATKNLEGGG